MKRLIYLLSIIFLFVNCQAKSPEQKTKDPKNIILLIGDGMGLTQLYSAFVVKKGHLNLERCKYTGFVKTYSADNLITDSGAGGTAIASGYKTNNKCIGMSPDSIPVKSILHYAEMNHKATGLVATSSITHATPASFIAHEPLRYNYEEIADDFLDTDIEVFIGGGLDHFTKRKDQRNIVKELQAKGYDFAANLAEVNAYKGKKLAALIYDGHPPYYADGRGEMLLQSSMKAIETLNKHKNGFFLMIESSQIDWAGHDQDSDKLVQEMLDFDNTIGAVLDFAEKDEETLVIITADHETGGYAITDGDIKNGTISGKFATEHHSAVMVPVMAFGPQAELFMGFMENIDIFTKMYTAFGFDPEALKKK